MKEIAQRLKSKVVWLAIVAQILTILLTLGVIDIGMETLINQVAAGILQLLVIFGVLNNPADSGNF